MVIKDKGNTNGDDDVGKAPLGKEKKTIYVMGDQVTFILTRESKLREWGVCGVR